ncbi:MAG: MarR family winged helix-turn-helix transcriptional regulator [Acidimicrobiales bacterium]
MTEPQDLVDSSHYRPLFKLLKAMDDDIAELYTEAGVAGFRPKFTGPLIRLGRADSMSIRELADAMDVTHSAMSQNAAAMRRAGLVRDARSDDARTRRVRLTPKARALVPFLEDEWRATERAVIELDAEIAYPIAQVVRDIEAALARTSFAERLRENLAALRDKG